MSRTLPPLTWFRSFEASARHLSFTAAADELGLTQSAVSQQVRSLEVRLGVDLFLRKPRGLALTDDGRTLSPKVGSALGSLSAAAALFETGSTAGLLSVATSVSVSQWIIAPGLAGFLRTRPGLRLRILGTIWPDEIKAEMADVEIRFGSQKQVGLRAERLTPDSLIPVAAPGLVGPMAEQTLIEAVGVSENWSDWARLAGAGPLPATRIYVDSHGAALDLAVNGAGVALTSSLLAREALASGEVIQAHPVELPSTEGYFLAVNAATDAATAFGDWIRGWPREPVLAGRRNSAA